MPVGYSASIGWSAGLLAPYLPSPPAAMSWNESGLAQASWRLVFGQIRRTVAVAVVPVGSGDAGIGKDELSPGD